MYYKDDKTQGGNGMVPHYSGTTLDAQIRYAWLKQCTIGFLTSMMQLRKRSQGHLDEVLQWRGTDTSQRYLH